MRYVVIAIVAVTAALAVPTAAADVHPRDLVLRPADVPAGFRVDRDDTGVRTNAEESAGKPEVRAFLARSGRISAYEIEFDRGAAAISSRADLFRSSTGGRMMLRYFDRELRKAGIAQLRRAASDVGAEGWIYHGRSPAAFTLVAWRQGRVFAGVAGQGVSRARTLELARVQQRRIVAALR